MVATGNVVIRLSCLRLDEGSVEGAAGSDLLFGGHSVESGIT